METTAYAGDQWIFDTTLLDSAGAPITSLVDAWFSIYLDADTELFSYQLSVDAELTLADNVLTCSIDPADTYAVAARTYFLDVKIKTATGGAQMITSRDLVRVVATSPLADNY